MEEAIATSYWCHICSRTVHPVMEDEIKCPVCQSGFIEEMGDEQESATDHGGSQSLWAPMLMEFMNDTPVHHPRRNQNAENDGDHTENEAGNGRESNLDWQLQEIMRRSTRHSAGILQLLQGMRAGLTLETEYNGDNPDRDRERVILINPFSQTITVQGSVDIDSVPAGSLGDYFIGPGFETLLQHLAETDPNRYGTPPAQKEAVEALATVKIDETLQCSVCLDDFEIGTEAKEMPCKHKFHSDCLLPWLELHSACPVCRYQLPADEPKPDSVRATDGSSTGSGRSSHENESSGANRRE